MPALVPPRQEVVGHHRAVEPHLLGAHRVLDQLTRPELLRRRLVSDPQWWHAPRPFPARRLRQPTPVGGSRSLLHRGPARRDPERLPVRRAPARSPGRTAAPGRPRPRPTRRRPPPHRGARRRLDGQLGVRDRAADRVAVAAGGHLAHDRRRRPAPAHRPARPPADRPGSGTAAAARPRRSAAGAPTNPPPAPHGEAQARLGGRRLRTDVAPPRPVPLLQPQALDRPVPAAASAPGRRPAPPTAPRRTPSGSTAPTPARRRR